MMSLGLTKPGLRSVDLSGKKHPITGLPIEPVGYLRDGTAVWPVIGGAENGDEDDPDFTGEGGKDTDDEDEDEDDDKDTKSRRRKPNRRKRDEDDDDEEDDEDEPKLTRPERQAARYRVALRKAEAERNELKDRLTALENKDKPADEVAKRDADEAKSRADKLAERLRTQNVELAFFKSNTVDWVDPADALRLVDLDEVDVDDDGTVDAKALRSALRDLAKRKPHLVKKAKVEPDADDDDGEEDDEEPRSRRSAPAMNRSRKGKGQTPSRAELAKKFPVLGRP